MSDVGPLPDSTAKHVGFFLIKFVEVPPQIIHGHVDGIIDGADFATMAKTHSEGPSKTNGGDLGYFGSAQMAPAFETAAFSLNPGEVSKIVSTQYGYHLIKVYDRKPAGKQSLEEAGPILKARFQQERQSAMLRQLVDQLKSKAKIERFPLKESTQ